jgi:hypothetical protein
MAIKYPSKYDYKLWGLSTSVVPVKSQATHVQMLPRRTLSQWSACCAVAHALHSLSRSPAPSRARPQPLAGLYWYEDLKKNSIPFLYEACMHTLDRMRKYLYLHGVAIYSAIGLLYVARSAVGRYTQEVVPCIVQLQTFVSDSKLWRETQFAQVQEVQCYAPERRQGCAQCGLHAAEAASALAQHNIVELVNSCDQQRNLLSPLIFLLVFCQ